VHIEAANKIQMPPASEFGSVVNKIAPEIVMDLGSTHTPQLFVYAQPNTHVNLTDFRECCLSKNY